MPNTTESLRAVLAKLLCRVLGHKRFDETFASSAGIGTTRCLRCYEVIYDHP